MRGLEPRPQPPKLRKRPLRLLPETHLKMFYMTKIIIIGGVAGGMSTAAKAKRENPELDVTVYERSRHISYSACGMPYHVAGRIPLENLVARTPEKMEEEGINVKVRHEVVGVDHDARQVRVKNLETGETFEDAYDTLVLATGARAVLPDLPGADLKGVYTLRRLEDAARIREDVGGMQGKHAVVMGGGYIGLEMAEAFREVGLSVTVVEAERLLSDFEPVFSELAEDELEAHGVTVHLQKKVAAFCGEGRVTGVGLSGKEDGEEGETLPADLALVAVGAAPNNDLAKTLGLALGPQGAVLTGGRLETDVENVYAVGDVTAVTHLVSGQGVWLPLGDTANRQGRVLGTVLGGGAARFGGVVGTFITKVFDRAFAKTGLSASEAEAAGFRVACTHIKTTDHASYYPDAQPLEVSLLWEEDTGRLLGAQIAASGDAAKRIDVAAALLQSRGTLQDLADLDLAYAPPFSSVWDPLLVAANVALSE